MMLDWRTAYAEVDILLAESEDDECDKSNVSLDSDSREVLLMSENDDFPLNMDDNVFTYDTSIKQDPASVPTAPTLLEMELYKQGVGVSPRGPGPAPTASKKMDPKDPQTNSTTSVPSSSTSIDVNAVVLNQGVGVSPRGPGPAPTSPYISSKRSPKIKPN